MSPKKFLLTIVLPTLLLFSIFTDIQGLGPTSEQRFSAAILDLSSRNQEPALETFTLKHTFEILGIPYLITTDLNLAQNYPIIYTAGSLQNATLSGHELELLYSYVENGGTLVSALVQGNKYFPLFGIGQSSPSRKRYEIFFPDSGIDPALKYIDQPEEKHIFLGNKKYYPEIIWTNSFKVNEARSLAKTEDGLTVIAVNDYGRGTAYVSGLAYTDVILTPHIGNDYEAQRGWSNIFEPGSDIFMLFLKAIFEERLNPYVYLSTIPYGNRIALLLSHDVDAQMSFENALEFAQLEKKYGVRSTYFITTKYVKDENDIGYYDLKRLSFIRKIKELKMDIGSHSVIHSKYFQKFPLGDETVNYQNYTPLKNPTVFGELKVSKELLDRDLSSQNTLLFRAGELKFPECLFDALQKSGYKYDSTFSACDIMTNFAFRPLLAKNVRAAESNLVEIPLTFDDSQEMLRPDNIEQMVAKWIDIMNANADNEAISVLLIHPSDSGYKLKAEEKLLTALKKQAVWINDLTSYGLFWNQRSQVTYDLFFKDGILTISLHQGIIPPGITFVVKDIPKLKSIELLTNKQQKINTIYQKRNQKIYLYQTNK